MGVSLQIQWNQLLEVYCNEAWYGGKWIVGSIMDDSMLGVLESDFLFIIVFIMNWALYFVFGFS
jgi:hypothetical protein